ncbi:MAG TPA: hypothetical protein VK528_06950, partial [Flavobacterium sp.]|nr:hypothetical protein [Flavobacterium sp.]
MKKFLGILVLVFLLNGCDDGDVTVNIIDFDGSAVGACGLLAYKLTENRALIIKLPGEQDDLSAFTNAFANDATPADTPTTLDIPGEATVTYRAYNGNISSDVLCSNPPPISPIAVEEWTATAGSIEITTTQINNAPNAETGQVTISKYQHSIVLKNMKYLKPDGTNQEEPFRALGNYST